MSKFGWSYPPGVTGNEAPLTGDYGPCAVCWRDPDIDPDKGGCDCTECPKCLAIGDPACYAKCGLPPRPDSVAAFLDHIGIEPLSAALRALDKHNVETSYRRAVVRANDTLDFTGLGVVSTDRPIPMDRGFAPLYLFDKPRDVRGPERAPVSQARTRQPKPPPRLALEEALMRCQRFFLLGDPGAGKTTTLRHLAHTYACGVESNRSYPAEAWIPIYVRLADWAQQLASSADMDVVDAAVAQLTGTDLDAQSTTQWLRDKARQGSVLLLLDGLDEVADPDLQAGVIERIRSFVQAHSEAHVVIASRTVGFNAPKLGADFDQLTIAPLDEEAIAELITNWSAFRQGHKSDRDCPTCNKDNARLHRAVLENQQIRRLAGNPMMLTILCLLCDAGATLPQRRWQLYEKIAEAFLFSWEERKRAGAPGALDHALKLDDREVVWLLESVAIEMQRRDFTIVPRWWLLEHCATFLRTELRFSSEDARSEAEALVWSLQERAGLLVERGLERYGFQHLGFQEYFAARAILAGDDPVEALQPYVYHPRWREVVRFVAAQLERRRASQLLRMILDDPDSTGRFLHRGLFIALGCLVDGAPGYDDDVLENLKHEIASLATSEWRGIALEAVDSVAPLREGRLKNFSREALDPLLSAPDPDLRTWAHVRLAVVSFMAHSAQP